MEVSASSLDFGFAKGNTEKKSNTLDHLPPLREKQVSHTLIYTTIITVLRFQLKSRPHRKTELLEGNAAHLVEMFNYD